MQEPFSRSYVKVSWEDTCESEVPFVNWRAPQEEQCNDRTIFACRFCLLQYGLSRETVDRHPQSKTEFVEHMRIAHGREAWNGSASHKN